MQETHEIATNEWVTNLLLGIIATLFSLSLVLVAYIWNRREKQYDQAHKDDLAYKETLEEKFEGINAFISKQKEKNVGYDKDITELQRNVFRNPPPPPQFHNPSPVG